MKPAPAGPSRSVAALPENRRHALYEQLKQSIYLGDLEPGRYLVESTLAAMYEVSRTPVREALLRLEQDGLVVRDSGGLTVRDHSPDEILDLYEVRILLEREAGRAAAGRRTTHDLLTLRKAAKHYEVVDVDNPRGMVETNREFHKAVWRCTHQLALLDLLERLDLHLGRIPNTTLTYPNRREATIEQHRAIVRAIEARDQERAGDLCAQHFSDARDIRLAQWEDED
ncbi:GntR family transcriptional regulator [Actinomadura luteofluorescens]|uniref:GntR family transcriptional regulator n=1 Tax=Actinomadura luteofluorescens TaxID=46163 RepID=UPI002164947A|nr:GntR family transcriptional regulator [Actinomadura glauciflava]MCR3740492.1 DNA-binding transcriptional regulator, GntR family [Actinomadura glauciflava]